MSASAFASSETPQQQFVKISDEYFDQVYFPNQPTSATTAGYHQFDTKLEDFSRMSVDAEVSALHAFESRVSAVPEASLDQPTRGDRQMVLGHIHSRLLTLETIRPWAKDADKYSSTVANAAFTLMERKFASPDDRLRSLIAREKQMPGLLAEARVNLQNPPRIFTEIAIEQLPGIIHFFESDVPLAFADAKDGALKQEFAETNGSVIASLNSYLNWLKTDLLPRSGGDFRIGAETFLKKLQYDEMVNLPLDRLLAIGYADMRRNREQFNRIAKELEPAKDPHAVLDELGHNHPAPDKLLDAFRATFNSLLGYIRAHHLVTVPSDVRPTVEETPPFMRATTFASMDSPGPLRRTQQTPTSMSLFRALR